jgi:hypothetical protein
MGTHAQRRMMKYAGCLSNSTCACVCIDISRTTLAHSITQSSTQLNIKFSCIEFQIENIRHIVTKKLMM